MAFLDKAGLQTLTNKLVQGDAIKVASSRGYTVKNVIDNITRECGDVENPQTMTFEDETGHFMIGKGKDIDVSGDIEAGKVAFGFKGITLQNMTDIDFTSVENYLGNENSPSGLSNLVSFSDGWMELTGNGEELVNFFSKKFNSLKPKTDYTLIIETKENSAITEDLNSKILWIDGYRDVESFSTRLEISYKDLESGKILKHLITSKEDVGQAVYGFRSFCRTDFIKGSLKIRYMLLEGDWTDKETPSFFTGIKSSFEAEEERKIIHTGKNLWEKGEGVLSRFDIYSLSDTSPILKANTDYTISVGNIKRAVDNGEYPHLRLSAAGEKDEQLAHYSIRPNSTFVVRTKKDVKMLIFYSNGFSWNGSKNHFATIENFQIEEGRGATEYAPYIKEEKTIELDEPLKGLPNGAYDEITEDGKLIRRLKKVVFSGEENWEIARNDSAVTERFILIQKDKKNVVFGHDFINDSFNIVYSNAGSSADDEYMFGYANKTFQIRINKTKISNGGLTGFKQWLAKNPITVVYELEKEDVVKIGQIAFNISQNNKIDIPSTITPITTYKVPLNRAAQIDNSIKTIQELKQRIELLEQAYDNHFLESQYKLSLLKLEHQIESEEI